MITFKCNKLVRDNAVAVLEHKGIQAKSHALEPQQLIDYLKQKIVEEAIEVAEVKTTEKILDELVDVMEASLALRKKLGVSEEEFMHLYEKKRQVKGGFEDGICVTELTLEENHPKVAHYRSHPKKYKEL